MKITAAATTAALALFAGNSLAAPAAEPIEFDSEASTLEARSYGPAFTVLAHAAGKPFDSYPFEVRYSNVYLGGVSVTEPCPLNAGPECDDSVSAILKADAATKVASLDVLKNNGEQLFVDSTGALRFAASTATVGTTKQFKRTAGNPGSFSFAINGATKTFMSCPVDLGMGNSYQVYVKTPGFKKTGCTPFTARSYPFQSNHRAQSYPIAP